MSSSDTGGTSGNTFRAHHLLALLPVIGILGAPWFANRVEPFVLGMPFLLAWIVGGVLMSSVIMGVITLLDRRAPTE